MNARETVAAFWQGMPPIWAQYRRRKHNDCPTDVRVEFVEFVDRLHRDGIISDAVADSVTLDSGRRRKAKS